MSQFRIQEQPLKLIDWQTSNNTIKCPTCNSTKVKRISGTSKAVSVAMFGLFSKTTRSQFQCESCGYKW